MSTTVQFSNRVKYDGEYRAPHTPFQVKDSDVPGLVQSGAFVLGHVDEKKPEEDEEARLLAEAKAEEERLAAEDAIKADLIARAEALHLEFEDEDLTIDQVREIIEKAEEEAAEAAAKAAEEAAKEKPKPRRES